MEYFFTLDWSNFILHDAVRIFCRENTVVFLRRGIGISSGWSSSLFTRPLCGSKNPKRSKARAGGPESEVRASLEFILRVVVAVPGQFFFNLNLEQPPRPPSPCLPPPNFHHGPLVVPSRSRYRRLYRTLDKQQ